MSATILFTITLFMVNSIIGMDRNVQFLTGTANALCIAIATNKALEVTRLLQMGVDPNLQSHVPPFETPLHVAAQHGRLVCAQLLLDAGADPYAENNWSTPIGDFGQTALHVAAFYGHCAMVSLLLNYKKESAQKVSIDLQTHAYGFTPLHYTAVANQEKVAQLLINRGANVEIQSSREHTPLTTAAFANAHKVIHVLVKAGAKIKPTLFIAIQSGITSAIQSLAASGANLKVVYENLGGDTPLHRATRFGQEWVWDEVLEASLEALLATKALDPNVVNATGNTPLHNAAASGRLNAVKMLVQAGADPKAKNNSQLTPAQLAKNALICRQFFDKETNIESWLKIYHFLMSMELQ